MKLRIFLFELFELAHHLHRIDILRQLNPVTEHRLEHRNTRCLLVPKPLSRIRCRQSRHRTDFSGSNRICGIKFFTRIQPDLINFFLKSVVRDPLLHLEAASGHFQIRQTHAAAVPPDLVHARRKLFRINVRLCIPAQSVKQMIHALQLKCRSVKAWEHQPLRHRIRDAVLSDASRIHILRQKFFFTDCKVLVKSLIRLPAATVRLRREIHTPVREFLFQLRLYRLMVSTCKIHLIDK